MRDESLTGQDIFTRAWRMRRVVLGDEALAQAEGEYDADDTDAVVRATFMASLAQAHYAAANVRASHTEPEPFAYVARPCTCGDSVRTRLGCPRPTERGYDACPQNRAPATGPTFDDAIEMLRGSGSGAFSSAASYLRQQASVRLGAERLGDAEYVGKRCVGCGVRAGDEHAEKCPVLRRLTQPDPRGCTCGAAMGVEHDKTCPSWFDVTTPLGRPDCTCFAVPGTVHAVTCPVGQAAMARGPMFPKQWCTLCGIDVEAPAAEHRPGCSYHGPSKTVARTLRPVRDDPQA